MAPQPFKRTQAQRLKTRIARAFSRAASSYDGAANLQTQVGDHLLRYLPEAVPGPILDLGAGTGRYAEPLGQHFSDQPLVLLDLAPGMLAQARQRLGERAHYLQGDAECLPFADDSLGLVFSSLALQWCADFSHVLAEIGRVLKPGGQALIATLAGGSMPELARAWQAVDGAAHLNRYPAGHQQKAQANASALEVLDWHEAPVCLHYPDLRALTSELKAQGVNTVLGSKTRTLTRMDLNRLTAAYEQERSRDGLPLTYQVIWAHLKAPEQSA